MLKSYIIRIMRMRKAINLAVIGCCLSLSVSNVMAQTDPILDANRYITRSTLYGVGFTNVYDSY